MKIEDMKQFSKKAADYSATIGEISVDMGVYMERCDADGDTLMHQRFEAARILLKKANEQITGIMEITDAETIAKEVA